MSKIFVFSNAIGTYTVLYIIKRLVGEDIDMIITTDETVFEHISNNFHFEMKYFNSINECISNCDLTIIFNDMNYLIILLIMSREFLLFKTRNVLRLITLKAWS